MRGPALGFDDRHLPSATLVRVADEASIGAQRRLRDEIHRAILCALDPDAFQHAGRGDAGHHARSTMRSMRKLDCSSASSVNAPKNCCTSSKSEENASWSPLAMTAP